MLPRSVVRHVPTVSRAEELFRGLVGRRTGIVRQIDLVETMDGDAPLFHAGAQIANAHPYHGDHLGLGVGGCGLTREEALISALCEGVERYAAASYPPSQQGICVRNDLGDVLSIDPRSLLAFSSEQRAQPDFLLADVTEKTKLRWEKGVDLKRKVPCYLPAFSVFLPYMLEKDEPLVAMGLSTGLACGPTLGEAVAKGICEALERDAMALTWVRGLTPPKLPKTLVSKLVGHVLPPRDEVTAYDLTTDFGVPVFFVVCRGMGPAGPLVAVGAACHPDGRRALLKAAMEASQDRTYVRMLVDRDPSWAPASDFSNVSDFGLHARVYSASPVLASRGFSFLKDCPEHAPTSLTVNDSTPEVAITSVLDHPEIQGAFVDLTPPWAVDLGLAVARVVLPDVMPLHGNHTLRYLGHPRLLEWEKAMPHATLCHSYLHWPYPHPMP